MAAGVEEAVVILTSPLRTRARRIAQAIIHIFSVWFVAMLILPWLDRARREAAVTRWARRTLGIFNVRVAVRGSPGQLDAPVMLVANHISWLDMYLLNALFVSRFVAKSEVASAPIFGTIARQLGSIFIRRGSLRDAHRVKGEAAAALRGGDLIGVFPEGTTSDGTLLQFFYPAMFQAAIEAGATIQPIAIRYHYEDGRLNTAPAYTDEVNLVRSIWAVLCEPVLRAEITFCEPLPAHLTRRELAHRARRSIAEALDVRVLPPRPRHLPGTRRRDNRESSPAAPTSPGQIARPSPWTPADDAA